VTFAYTRSLKEKNSLRFKQLLFFRSPRVKGAHLTSKGLIFSSKTMNNISYSIKQ